MSHGGTNERASGYLVSGNYFDVLGVKLALGSGFLPEEDKAPWGEAGRGVELRLLAATLRRRSSAGSDRA